MTASTQSPSIESVKAKELLRVLRGLGCKELRQEGSHIRIECDKCHSTVVMHPGEDIGKGLLRRIERDLEPCLGKRWLQRK